MQSNQTASLSARLPARRLTRGAACLALLLATGACSLPGFMTQPAQVRGNKVDDEQLVQLVPGTSTRQDVVALLGTPTARASFDDNTWLYIGSVTKPEIGATNIVEEQKVVAISFDQRGVLRGVSKKTQDDSVPVSVVARATPSPGTESTFLQQLLGNIGKFNPGSAANGPGAGRGVSGNY